MVKYSTDIQDLVHIKQFFVRFNSSSISQLIMANQEICKNYSNILMEQQNCASSILFLFGVLLFIFVLYSKD